MAFLVPLAVAGAGTAAAAGGTLATIGTIASVVSAGLGVLGAIQQGRAASQAASYNAKVAENNAKTAQQNRDWAAAEGNANVEAKQMETRAKVGALKSAQAASGVNVNSGSSVDVRMSQSDIGALDAMNIRANAMRRAYGYETQAANETAQAGLDRFEGKSASTAGYIKGGSTFLGGLSDYAWQNYQDDRNNTFPTRDIMPRDIIAFGAE